MLFVFLWYIGCISSLYHSHTINGKRIVHSHSVSDKSNGKVHTHSNTELATINCLCSLLAIVNTPFSFLVFYSISSYAYRRLNAHEEILFSFLSYLRAPPSFTKFIL